MIYEFHFFVSLLDRLEKHVLQEPDQTHQLRLDGGC
jgi:hypothetical protein